MIIVRCVLPSGAEGIPADASGKISTNIHHILAMRSINYIGSFMDSPMLVCHGHEQMPAVSFPALSLRA